MNRTTLAKRYLPLAAVIAVQLLIIAVVPSRAPQNVAAGDNTGVGAGPGGSNLDGNFTVDDQGNIIDPNTGEVVGRSGSGGSGGSGGTSDTGGSTGGPSGQVANPLGIPTSGDTGHCKNGRQFDPAIDYAAPPCIPKFTGKNPGATYQGVTADKITIVDYYAKGNPAVDGILKAQGAFVEAAQQQAFDDAAADFINKNYELYGRKVEIKLFEGKCDSVPPDYRCLRNEVRQLISERKPFAIKWNTSLASPFFAEASAAKTLNVGGWHFRDSFGKQWAPYHYDVQISGTQAVKQFAEYWCKSLNGRPAKYAGDPGIQARQRSLGVISTNDPENAKTIKIDLKDALASGCGASYGNHEYYYAQDISTANQQKQAGVSRMRTAPEATSVLCFCDLVAPAFLYQEEESQKYYPENLVAGSGFMDADKAARAYDTLLPGNPDCRCNREFINAFGLSSISTQEPLGRDLAARMWRSTGRSGNPPYDAASQHYEYFSLLGTLLQQAGPNLNPNNVALGQTLTPPIPGGAKVGKSINPKKGDYTWNDDMRQVYWSPTRPSSFDGKPGSYVDMFPGRRFNLGQYGGEVNLPPKQPNSTPMGSGRP